LTGSYTEEAVSPVLGTILLVAVTVVLAAAIAAVTLGIAGGLDSSYRDVRVGVNGVGFFECVDIINGREMVVPYCSVIIYGGSDVGELSRLELRTNDDIIVLYRSVSKTGDIMPSSIGNVSASSVIGQPLTFLLYTDAKEKIQRGIPVSLIGTFADGIEVTLLTTSVSYTVPSDKTLTYPLIAIIYLSTYHDSRYLQFMV
jgi:flagellin-like protein